MASISRLSNPNPIYSSTSFKPKSVQLKCLIDFNCKTTFDHRVSSSRLSISTKPASSFSLFVRCSQFDGNGGQIKKTVLHDLYEKEGPSPWYDNLCRPVTDGGDGYVSVEVSPRLADDTVGTVEAAKWLHKLVDRRNVTLIFSLARYEAVIDAYLDGLEASGLSDLSKVTSVASFFVSRVDTLVDKMLEKIGTPEALDLRGKAANAQAALAYQLYQKKFSGPRWEALVKKGAKKQRLLWASTSVKNPAYSDTLYAAHTSSFKIIILHTHSHFVPFFLLL
ncbi:unnamed protein product [Camellia sinensis]